MDAVDEELKRWIERAKAGLAQLPPGSSQQRHLARAIRRMTLTQLRHRINRAHGELSRLPGGSDERQELEQAVEQMDEQYRVGLREIRRTHRVDTEDRTLAEVRRALGAGLAPPHAPDSSSAFTRRDRRDRARPDPPQGIPRSNGGLIASPASASRRYRISSKAPVPIRLRGVSPASSARRWLNRQPPPKPLLSMRSTVSTRLP
jgi:hypothetical protein